MAQAPENFDYTKLSIPERLQLVEEIWDSIAAENEPFPLTQAQKEELDRRIEDYKKNPNEGSTWEEIKQRLMPEE